MTDTKDADGADGAGTPRPIEPVLSQATSDRITRIAKTLFAAADAQIVVVENDRAWNSRKPEQTTVNETTRALIASAKPVWVADGRTDPDYSSAELVVGPPYLRFLAANSIVLNDGSIAGLLAVFDTQPHPYDAALQGRLRDLADIIADEWERAAERRLREQLLSEREAAINKFTAVVQAMPVSLVVLDKALDVLQCSPRWAEEAGHSPQAVVGRALADLMPLSYETWRPVFSRVLAGERVVAERVRSTIPGSNRWLSVELAPWRDCDGAVGGLIISLHDITDAVAALQSSEHAKQRLTLAMGLSSIHVWEMDYTERKLIKEGSENHIFSEPKTYEELLVDPFCTVDPRDRDRVKKDWVHHLQTGERYQTDYRVVRSDDKECWVSCSCELVTDEAGRPLRLIGALQNITERKLADSALLKARDDAETATRAKSAFLAAMSHEIRTPLNGVLGMAQAMAADSLPGLQRQRLDVIRQSGETLLNILNDILDLSKIEAGRLELEEVDFDLQELCRAAHNGFAAVAAGKELAFELELAEGARGIYRGDPTRVRQILANIISNALKFTSAGRVAVEVSRTGEEIKLAVSDTGIGVPQKRLDRLFQKFEQGDASTTRRYGGTGLGLAICRELAELLNGRITAQSEEGRGSTFTVTLPLTRVSDEVRRPVDKDVVAVQGIEQRLRVLVAEDNSVNQLVIKTLLNQAGVDPLIVADGAQALRAWQAHEWDIILMDVQMPNMDGPTATASIRSQERASGRRRTPILALTANAMSHQLEQYRAAGMDGFVTKPIEVARLFKAIDTSLSQAERAQGAEAAA